MLAFFPHRSEMKRGGYQLTVFGARKDTASLDDITVDTCVICTYVMSPH